MIVLSDKEISKRLSKFIRKKRDEKGITQESLAEIADIDYKHIQRLESESIVHDPKLSTIMKLAEAFNLKVSDVIDDLYNR